MARTKNSRLALHFRTLTRVGLICALIFETAVSAAAVATEDPDPACVLNLTTQQKKLVAEQMIRDFQRSWRLVNGQRDPSDEAEMLRLVYPLFRHLYVLQSADRVRFPTMTEASRYVLAKNTHTKQKYLRMAIDQGFLTELLSEADARVRFLIPTEHMIEFVEREASAEIDEKLELARQIFLQSQPNGS